MRHLAQTIAAAAVAAFLLLIGAGPAAAQGYDTPDETVVIDDTSLVPGERFTVSGSGFRPGSTVEVFFRSDPVLLGTLTATATGVVSGSFEVPEGAEPGRHTVELRGVDPDGDPRVLSVTVTVAGATAAPGERDGRPGARNLAFTGAMTLGFVTVGGLAVAAGVMLLRLRQRRSGTA